MKVYDEVKIGNQIWMSRNLGVDTFRNGDPIPEAKTFADWKQAKNGRQPASCYYRSPNSVNDRPYNTTPSLYGRLYNWYAVNDPRGLAPEGWHIPTDEEWTELVNFLGGETAGRKLKAINSGWKIATNESGFSALPCGARLIDFDGEGELCHWWTTSKTDPEKPIFRSLVNSADPFPADLVITGKFWKDAGLSVRCIKD